jgi:Transposase IS116/IS110/IS902 family
MGSSPTNGRGMVPLPIDFSDSLAGDDAELAGVTPHRVDQGGALSDQGLAHLQDHALSLLSNGFHRHKMHARTPGGLADRFGVVPLLSAIEQEAAIPPEGREMFVLLGHQIDEIDARIKKLISTLRRAQGQRGQPASRLHSGRRTDHCINAGCRDQPGDVRIRRHLAAWAGLTTKERSTGGKQRMGGISRAGNERLRVLLGRVAGKPTGQCACRGLAGNCRTRSLRTQGGRTATRLWA